MAVTYTQIESLVTDSGFQELKYKQEKSNLFSIVGQTHKEHWHSAFISWLLDAHSSLRLGHYPLARLLTLYMVKNPECGYDLADLYRWNLDTVRFQTEKDASMQGKKRSIDVYGESDELIIVIENKVNAHENFNHSDVGQTQDYYDYVQAHKTERQKACYFFITPDPRQKSYADMYERITYQELYDNVIAKCLEHPQLSGDARYLLEQYAANLKEVARGSKAPMALTNIELCKNIYDAHTEVLDAIFHAVDGSYTLQAGGSPESLVYERYQGVFDEIYLSVDERYGRSPKSAIERQVIRFTELYRRGKVADGMRFTMKYDGVEYHARIVLAENRKDCYLQILDENEKPFRNEQGEIVGIYESSSSAGIDAINYYRKQHGITPLVKTLRGTTYWVNEEGKTIKELMDDM